MNCKSSRERILEFIWVMRIVRKTSFSRVAPAGESKEEAWARRGSPVTVQKSEGVRKERGDYVLGDGREEKACGLRRGRMGDGADGEDQGSQRT